MVQASLFLSLNFDSKSYISELRTFVSFDTLRSELESPAPPSITTSSTASSGPDLGRLPRNGSDRESREREQRERGASLVFWKMVYEKKKFINHFPFFFFEGFSGQLQIISVDFYFTAKQTSANDENVLRRNKRSLRRQMELLLTILFLFLFYPVLTVVGF
jgi:hypothetical protein